ncbi:MAG TPA: heavy-metal-associated domain-containing protein [Methylophilaceae bacterium]|jgi:copper chaperone
MKLLVKDMTCEHCASVITQAIKALDAAAHISIDISSKIVSIDTKIDNEDVLDAILDEGYTPEVIEA